MKYKTVFISYKPLTRHKQFQGIIQDPAKKNQQRLFEIRTKIMGSFININLEGTLVLMEKICEKQHWHI